MSSSKITVVVLVGVSVLVVAVLALYVNEHGGQQKLTSIDCGKMLPTTMELQGVRLPVSREQTCDMIEMVAGMQSLDTAGVEESLDPSQWHYFGRMRIRPSDDVWFLVFIAHPAENFRPTFSLRHRKGNGWAIVGRFDAAAVLKQLELNDRIDMEKLKSPAALTPVDQMSPM